MTSANGANGGETLSWGSLEWVLQLIRPSGEQRCYDAKLEAHVGSHDSRGQDHRGHVPGGDVASAGIGLIGDGIASHGESSTSSTNAAGRRRYGCTVWFEL